MVEIGNKARLFSLPSTSGGIVALRKLRGKKVVVYFYPRDDTPGCTREACDFRDNLARVRATGAVVLGVSSDTLASHDKFRAKYSLPFDLLSDTDHAVAKKYGAWGEKTLYGKKSMGTIRSTFVIDEEGRITAKWSPVRVNGHVDEVLAALGADTTARSPQAAAIAGPKVGAGAPSRKPSQKNRTFAQPASAKAGKAPGKLAAARASEYGRGYRQTSRNSGKRDSSGKR